MATSPTVFQSSLPGLTAALNADAILELLTKNLPECGAGLQVLEARIVDVQYAPYSNAQILWKISVRDDELHGTSRQLVFVNVLRDDDPGPAEPVDLVRRYKQIRDQKGMAGHLPLRTPWLWIPGARLAVHAFPLDPALPSLLDAVDPQAMKLALNRMWHPRRTRVRRIRVNTLAYTPQQRAALKYEVQAENKDTLAPEIRHLVGKLHARRSPARLFAGHWAVWRQTAGRVSIAPPVGYLGAMRLSLQEFVSGTRLSDLAGPGRFVGYIRTAARSIGTVHSLTLPLLSERGVDKEMLVIARWAGVLAGLRPIHAPRLERIRRRLEKELADRMKISGTVHADFHLANMLADDDRVHLIDWDQVAHGDPMIDVGRTLASLRVSSLRVHGTLGGFTDLGESFLQAYLDHTNGDERRARLFEAVALLVAAAAPFRLQREAWEEAAELMLEEVERAMALSLAGPRIPGTSPDYRPEIPFSQRLGWTQDRLYSQSVLLPLVHETYGPDIEITETFPGILEQSPSFLHVRWTLKGYKRDQEWRAELEGAGFADDDGKGCLRRVVIANEVLRNNPAALQFPRVVGHLAPLSLQIFVAQEGRTIADVLGTPGESAVVRQLACALATFHSLKIVLQKEKTTEHDVQSLAGRLCELEARHPPAARAARELFSRIASEIADAGERRGPAIRGLRLRQLRSQETSVTATVIHDIVLAEPLVGAGDIAAQLCVHALMHGRPPEAATHFRRCYAESFGETESALAAFEALALLRRACRCGANDPTDPLVAALINAASERIGTSRPRRL